MSATVLPLDGEGHLAVQALLPWYATGRLDADDLALVRTHLEACAQCRVELDWERRMAAAQSGPAVQASDVEAGLARLHRRILARPEHSRTPLRKRWRVGVLGWLVAAEFATIAVLAGAVFVSRDRPAVFHALGAPDGRAVAKLIVRFRPEATATSIRLALQAAGAHIVDGPTVTGAYLLDAPSGREAQALARLRSDRAVALAESLQAGVGP